MCYIRKQIHRPWLLNGIKTKTIRIKNTFLIKVILLKWKLIILYYLYDLISILLLGNKFVPNFSFNKRQFLNFLLHNLDVNFIKFDNFLNISKAEFNKNQSTINLNIDDNLDSSNDKNFNNLMKEINKKQNIKKKKKKISSI